uniref:Uncharacterized protein n=1 Tax=Leptobrachium leishanense TaxID=445787 RepID=A0A8C5PSR8_9ANUR
MTLVRAVSVECRGQKLDCRGSRRELEDRKRERRLKTSFSKSLDVKGSRDTGRYLDGELGSRDVVKMCIFQALWEACQRRTGEHKNMLQMILCNKSHQQLFMDFEQFQNVSGQDIADAISECFDGYFQQLLLAIVSCVRDKPSYFAYRLHRAIHDFGFHNKTVIRIMVARSEIDLMNIKQLYKERYGKSLHHDFKVIYTLLLVICN